MIEKTEQISPFQFQIITFMFVLGSTILFLPPILTSVANQDGWISSIIGILIGFILVWFYTRFHKVNPEMSYIECAVFALGKWGGGFVAFWTFVFYLELSAILLWDIGDFMITQILPGTPIQAIYYLFILVVLYGIGLGIEPIARTAEIFAPWIVFLFIVITVLLLPEVQTTNITPIYEKGISTILYGSYYMMGFPFLEMVSLLMITPYISEKQKVTKSFFLGVAFASIVLITLILLSILVLGPDFTTRNEFPVYVLGKKVSIGDFLERIEIVIALMWIITIYFKISVIVYSLLIGMKQLFKLKDYRPLSFPIGVLIVTLTLIILPNSTYLKNYSKYAGTPFLLFIGLLLPLGVLVVAKYKMAKMAK